MSLLYHFPCLSTYSFTAIELYIEALKEQKTLSALSKEFNLHPQQITDWKKQALSGLPTLFEGGSVFKVIDFIAHIIPPQ